MKQLQLTNSTTPALVSDEDYQTVANCRWFLRKNGYIQSANNSGILLHRAIMKPTLGMEVDHINRNRMDNRRENLRICTHKENCQNKGQWGKSGHKYIYYKRKIGLFSVQIPVNGKVKSCGYRKDIADAVLLRDSMLRLIRPEKNNP